jgi:hypothetical protein
VLGNSRSVAPYWPILHPVIALQCGALATAGGLLRHEGDAAILHEGVTRSFKEVQKRGRSSPVDHFKDATGRFLMFEPRMGRGGYGIADPSAVHALRWMAARNLGAPEFDPP